MDSPLPCTPALRDHRPRELREVLARKGDDLDLLKDLLGELEAVAFSVRVSLETIESGHLRIKVRGYADQFDDWIRDTIGAEVKGITESEDSAKQMMSARVPVSAG